MERYITCINFFQPLNVEHSSFQFFVDYCLTGILLSKSIRILLSDEIPLAEIEFAESLLILFGSKGTANVVVEKTDHARIALYIDTVRKLQNTGNMAEHYLLFWTVVYMAPNSFGQHYNITPCLFGPTAMKTQHRVQIESHIIIIRDCMQIVVRGL